ncbi:MAG: 3'-5' exonuclease [Sutterellaceae bacterium]|nr:3'-5' exonuclease [Sutterellaceae bacterium]
MLSDLVESLNPMQRKAVELGEENALILAGAGSGKTKVLTTRIAWLIANNMAYPSQILAVTFTNKAAREMRSRLEAMVSADLSGLWMGTFHGIAHKLLRLHYQDARLPKNFQIIDSSDQLSLIKRIMKDAGIDTDIHNPKSVQASINRFKEAGLRSGDVRVKDEQSLSIYQIYEERCHREGLVDFAELLLASVELLERNEILREHYADRFRWILVDEFQDTNELQFRWIRALANPKSTKNFVFCVGDDDQSIYAFRGARVGNMADFVKDYGITEIVKLEQNYRSTSHILDAANAVIANNTDRMGKNLWTDQNAGTPIDLYNARDDRDDARSITQDIMTNMRTGMKYSDFAVLYRNNSQSRVIEQYFTANGISYRIYGGLRFFDRAEVKDITAYLRVMTNPDDTSLLRVINHPPRGIGATSLERVTERAKELDCSLWDIISHPSDDSAVRRTQGFVKLIEDMREACQGLNLPDTIGTIIEKSGLKAHYEAQKDRDIRLENLSEVVNAASGYCSENGIGDDCPAFEVIEGGQMSPVDGFLSQATLEADDKNNAEEQNRDCVQLMTVHASKGLEFNTVYLTGLEEGLFPHGARDGENPEKALSEERRLMYVAMTRARKRLRISWCEERMLYGRSNFSDRSQFIDEIPAKHIHEINPRKSSGSSSHIDGDWQESRYGSGRYGRFSGGYGNGYGNSYGSGRSGYGSSSYSSSGSKNRYSGLKAESAKDLHSNEWRNAGLKKASDYLPSQTGSGMATIKKKEEVANVYGYNVGDVVEHKIFGRGKIEKILYPEKKEQMLIHVRFATGMKELLAQFASTSMTKIS